ALRRRWAGRRRHRTPCGRLNEAFKRHRGESRTREAEDALEDEVSRLPARRELRVEAVQALHLEIATPEDDEPRERALESSARPLEQPPERGEVERELLDAAFPQQLDRSNDEELRQAVRRVSVPAHERQRHRRPAVRRNEMEKATHDP